MKDLDLRTETAARKRARKKAERRRGVPKFVHVWQGNAAYWNKTQRLLNGYERLKEQTEATIARARRVPFDRAEYERSNRRSVVRGEA